MDDSQREQMLMLARGVLPELPCTIQVLSEDGGSFDLHVQIEQDGLLHAIAPRDRIRDGLRVLGRIVDPTRGRYEVELEVMESFWHSQTEVLTHLAVNSVQHQKMRRASPASAGRHRRHTAGAVLTHTAQRLGVGGQARRRLVHRRCLQLPQASRSGRHDRHRGKPERPGHVVRGPRDPLRPGSLGPVPGRVSADHGRRLRPRADRAYGRRGPRRARRNSASRKWSKPASACWASGSAAKLFP